MTTTSEYWVEIIDRMNKRINDLEDKISKQSFIGIDVGYKEQTTIIVVSKLHNGQIRIIETNFDDIRSLETFVQSIKKQYGIERTIRDDIVFPKRF